MQMVSRELDICFAEARYACHALIVLAEHGDSEPIMIADVAAPGARCRGNFSTDFASISRTRHCPQSARTIRRLTSSGRLQKTSPFRSDPHDRRTARPRPLRQRDRLSKCDDCLDEEPAPSARCCWRRAMRLRRSWRSGRWRGASIQTPRPRSGRKDLTDTCS